MRCLVYALILSFYCVTLDAAQPVEYLRYSGFDVGHSFVNTFALSKNSYDKKVRHQAQYLNWYFGYRIGKYSSVEMGVFKVHSLNSSCNHREGTARSQGFHLGFVFSLPLTCRLSLVPGLGVNHVYLHTNSPDTFDIKEEGPTPRVLLGLEYRINDEYKVRLTGVYSRVVGFYSVPVSFNRSLNIGVGLNYSFWPK